MRLSLLLPLLLGGMLCLGGPAPARADENAKAQAKADAELKSSLKHQRREQRNAQSDSRMDQILHPSTERSFDLSREKRFGSKDFTGHESKVVETKGAYQPQKFSAKEYLTGSYHNDKSYWMGDFKYSVGDANATPHSSYLAQKKTFQTKDAAVKDAAGIKKYTDSSTNLPTREYRGKESQRLNTALTPEQATKNGYGGELREMRSVDDVRALLNKSK